MLSSKCLLLSLGLACLPLWCPSATPAQSADLPQQNQHSTRLHVRSFVCHYYGSFKRVSPDEMGQRLQEKGLLPVIEKPYDQAQVDLIKTEIVQLYKEHGITVGAYSAIEPANGPRAVRITLEIYKL